MKKIRCEISTPVQIPHDDLPWVIKCRLEIANFKASSPFQAGVTCLKPLKKNSGWILCVLKNSIRSIFSSTTGLGFLFTLWQPDCCAGEPPCYSDGHQLWKAPGHHERCRVQQHVVSCAQSAAWFILMGCTSMQYVGVLDPLHCIGLFVGFWWPW